MLSCFGGSAAALPTVGTYAIIVFNIMVKKGDQVLGPKRAYIDLYVLAPYVVLSLFSIIMVYSASGDYIHMQFDLSTTAYMWRQMAFVLVGFALCTVTFMLRIGVLRRPWFLGGGMVITIALLMYLLVKGRVNPSTAINGASSWIPVGPINIQPSEIGKLLIVLYLAHMLTRREVNLNPRSLIDSAGFCARLWAWWLLS